MHWITLVLRAHRIEAERARLEGIVLDQQETLRKLYKKLERPAELTVARETNTKLNKENGRLQREVRTLTEQLSQVRALAELFGRNGQPL